MPSSKSKEVITLLIQNKALKQIAKLVGDRIQGLYATKIKVQP